MRRQTRARPIVPVGHLLHEDEARRCQHVDLAGLTERQLWAEQRIVDNELARLTFNDVRPRRLNDEESDQSWLAARSCRLRDELAKRRAARGRHAA